ncbi:diguanylate cyclase [Paraglaciecola sp. 2405UD69-4]|uniref:GGDEF domain-containing response regulator n=1 Tax=Paraglaciecola sp. 2405UD69-4 TaxID=3391836 RepID=UPI0039C96AAA
MTNTRLLHMQSKSSFQTSPSIPELKKQTLMIVDDYQANLQAMIGLFDLYYNVVVKDNAKDAIQYAIHEEVDLILLDVDMPEMDGYEACSILKSDPITSHISIIFVTAATDVEEEEKGLLLGAVDYVTKPVNLSILRIRVKNQMELIYYRKQLEILSCVDGLTGAANRRQLDTMLLQHYAAAVRMGNCLSVMMIDIDNFKSFNDMYGHAEGDDCLKKVAKAITAVQQRETDLVGRYGGEEFAVSLQNTDIEGCIVVAEQILERVRNLNIEHAGSPVHKRVTVSIGLAVFKASANANENLTLEQLLHQADEQLYKAKSKGKNCYSYESSLEVADSRLVEQS